MWGRGRPNPISPDLTWSSVLACHKMDKWRHVYRSRHSSSSRKGFWYYLLSVCNMFWASFVWYVLYSNRSDFQMALNVCERWHSCRICRRTRSHRNYTTTTKLYTNNLCFEPLHWGFVTIDLHGEPKKAWRKRYPEANGFWITPAPLANVAFLLGTKTSHCISHAI